MKKFKNIKNKKLIVTGALVGILLTGSSLAYFTDTKSSVNKFTVGSVEIELHEDKWNALADDNDNDIPDVAERIVPNKTITKDPSISNVGLNSAWVYLQVDVPISNIITANENGKRNDKKDTELFLFNASSDWSLLKKTTTGDKATYVYGYNYKLEPNAKTSNLFDNVTFCNVIEDQELEEKDLKIDVKAMAIQSEESGTMETAYNIYIEQETTAK